jgi:hypothetical protein
MSMIVSLFLVDVKEHPNMIDVQYIHTHEINYCLINQHDLLAHPPSINIIILLADCSNMHEIVNSYSACQLYYIHLVEEIDEAMPNYLMIKLLFTLLD